MDNGNESYPRRPQRYPHPKGVYRTAYGTWYAQVQHRGERYYLGTCATVEEAVELRTAFAQAASPVE